jgi:LPXTG-site transpeptidase (sortase) family protein
MKTSSALLIIFGILWLLLGGYYLWLKNSPDRLSFKNYKQIQIEPDESESEKKSLPKRIIINDLNINIPLIPAKVDNDKWETTHDGASYLVSSPIPGNTGNSIVYGHNWTSILGNLVNTKPGHEIKIIFADGSQKRFIVNSTSTVNPTDSSVLAQTEDQRITLYTCTGFLDSKRFVVVAFLDKNPSFTNITR